VRHGAERECKEDAQGLHFRKLDKEYAKNPLQQQKQELTEALSVLQYPAVGGSSSTEDSIVRTKIRLYKGMQ